MDDFNVLDSVEDWIERARRAQDLVGKVDLARIGRHDPDEVDKLVRVTGALGKLSNGDNVAFLPGVDEDEAPDLDPQRMRRSALMELLTTEGLGDRLGRVFACGSLAGGEGAMRPLDLIPHRQGLPDFHLCVAPDFAPTEGAQAIFISDRGVFTAMIPDPVTRHQWRITRSRPCDDERDMLATLRRFISRTGG